MSKRVSCNKVKGPLPGTASRGPAWRLKSDSVSLFSFRNHSKVNVKNKWRLIYLVKCMLLSSRALWRGECPFVFVCTVCQCLNHSKVRATLFLFVSSPLPRNSFNFVIVHKRQAYGYKVTGSLSTLPCLW